MSAKEAQNVDLVTVEIIERALRSLRDEMDAVVLRSAMSPIIREQHDEFPLVTNADGLMLVGQFGSYVPLLLETFDETIEPGDVVLQSDPYLCDGAIQHTPDWLVLVPIDYGDARVGYTSMFGHMLDVGGSVPGSMAATARSVWEEGLRIPPIKLFSRGELNRDVLKVILRNSRTPDINEADLFAIVAACRTGADRVVELCERFGLETYLAAGDAMLARTREAVRRIILTYIPEEPVVFEDVVDDDGQGNGPFRMRLSIHRVSDRAVLDWTGSDPEAPGPINLLTHEGLFKMFVGIYLIMAFDPEILFNEGFHDLIEVELPEGSILKPRFPAPLGLLNISLARQLDVVQGALAACAPEYAAGAGYGSSPAMTYSGNDERGRYFQLGEISYGGLPGRPKGDGLDGHSWWPLFTNIPTEYIESYYPVTVERYRSASDSGGAGRHRGGNGIEKVYRFEVAGEVTIQDDRWRSLPWGVEGGLPGAPSRKVLLRSDGAREELPSKCDLVPVAAGDRLLFITAGAGGLGDPSGRDPAAVRRDVRRGLVSAKAAARNYGTALEKEDT
ncbi:MAG: hydantoinase B/oxoprolinase family protein [Actinomycetia bacterium]|nr:hydantoinase B/oxoprolinase family protein [Actinomycetes bacterium]